MFLEEVSVSTSSDDESSTRDNLGRLTGEVIKTVRDSIRQGFLDWSPRLMLAMYSCEIQASSMFLPSPLAHITTLTSPSSRSPRPRLRRHHPPPRPHPLRIPQRRHPLLHHPLPPSRRGVLWLQRRDPQTHLGRGVPAADFPRLRAAGRGSVLGAVYGGRTGGSGRAGGSRECGETVYGCGEGPERVSGEGEEVGQGCREAEDIEEVE